MDERTKRLADVARTLEEAKAEIQRIAAEEMASGEVSAQRRKMLGLGAGLVAGAAAVAAMQPKEADAQFFGSGFDLGGLLGIIIDGGTQAINDTIREPIDVTREITEVAFSFFRALGIPSSVIAILNDLLGLRGTSGEHSMTLPDNVPAAMEISWPEAPESLDSAYFKMQAAQSALATRARVLEACTVCSTAADGQAAMQMADAQLIEEANAAAAEGNVTTILLAIANLVATGSNRQSQIIQMINEQMAVTGDAALREQAARWYVAQPGGTGDALRTPVDDTLAPTTINR